MSYSLQIMNGDLVAQGGQLGIVTGAQKLLQDLSTWILTRMGSDQYEPGYGSLIDGGVKPDGTVVVSPLGTTNWNNAQSNIQQEIVRITTLYQALQNQRQQDDIATYNASTLTADELLTGVTGISFNPLQDALLVTISITNGANQALQLTIPIQTTVL